MNQKRAVRDRYVRILYRQPSLHEFGVEFGAADSLALSQTHAQKVDVAHVHGIPLLPGLPEDRPVSNIEESRFGSDACQNFFWNSASNGSEPRN